MSNEIVHVVLEGDFISGQPLSDEQILLNAEMIYGVRFEEIPVIKPRRDIDFWFVGF